MNQPTLRSPRTLRLTMTISSIVFALLWTGGMFVATAPQTPAGTVILVIAGVLAGLFWHVVFGAWYRDYFKLDRDYRRVGGGETNPAGTRPRFRLSHAVFLLLSLLGTVWFGLAAVHYVQGSCTVAGDCLQQVDFIGRWVLPLLVLGFLIDRVERRGETNADGTKRRLPVSGAIFVLFFLLGLAWLGLAAVQVVQRSCSTLDDCLGQVYFLGRWLFPLFLLGAVVELIERFAARRRPRPPAAP